MEIITIKSDKYFKTYAFNWNHTTNNIINNIDIDNLNLPTIEWIVQPNYDLVVFEKVTTSLYFKPSNMSLTDKIKINGFSCSLSISKEIFFSIKNEKFKNLLQLCSYSKKKLKMNMNINSFYTNKNFMWSKREVISSVLLKKQNFVINYTLNNLFEPTYAFIGICVQVNANYNIIGRLVIIRQREYCGNDRCDSVTETCSNCAIDCGKCSWHTILFIILIMIVILIFLFVVRLLVKILLKFYKNYSEIEWYIKDTNFQNLIFSNFSKYCIENSNYSLIPKPCNVLVEKIKMNGPLKINSLRLKYEIKQILKLNHENLVKFKGLFCVKQDACIYVCSQYCKYGNLSQLLKQDNVKIDYLFKFSFCFDIISGLAYLHKLGIFHENLSTENCFLGNDWLIKLDGFTLNFCRKKSKINEFKVKQTCCMDLIQYSRIVYKIWTNKKIKKNNTIEIEKSENLKKFKHVDFTSPTIKETMQKVIYEIYHSKINALEIVKILKDSDDSFDNYVLIISGLWNESNTHSSIFDAIERIHKDNLNISIGINIGPVSASAIGKFNCRFSVYGDTVNVASRMLSKCPKNSKTCLITDDMYRFIQNQNQNITSNFNFTKNVVAIKGKGEMTTWWLKHKNTN
ncbi:hypothetical protein A3Q56_01035 [Intoshia linei]|uniref:guanylate cyclase n=1 Tax=Intoshia linei TaxID=1819745 RepID=A0A177BA14_9BILA|nr:hypothetical protein A3Q56_01035 [Intoshia linei]